jgi:DNA-binding Xre family transcriptional regulator
VKFSLCQSRYIPHTEWTEGQKNGVPNQLGEHLARFLRQQRGEMTFAEFSRITGLPPSTLYRLERMEQSITLGRLELLMNRLKCRLEDIFPEEWVRAKDTRK